MPHRALTFGSAAAAYETFRLGYPDEVADAVLDYARRPVRTALEIGAGTGKATRLFDRRGMAVTATEPDAAMLAELRRHAQPGTTTQQAAFEDLTPPPTYDLVYVAAALHWTSDEGRWPRMAGLLNPTGVFANIGGPVRLAEPDLEEAVRTARAPWLTDDDIPSPDGTAPSSILQWPGTELERSALFTDVRQVVIPRRVSMRSDRYVGNLSTVSAYLQLPQRDRTQALDAIHRALPDEVEVLADVHVHLARKA
ncbi:MAG TPA: class I SAM-dependent methyltransferase [Lapillicoccus sp.]|nr:class I SAM-dependent methyltransferase [Lapillicoccus sp.]